MAVGKISINAIFGQKGASALSAVMSKLTRNTEDLANSSGEVNKQQTRQGRISQNTTKGFSSQAAGLGGLVGAYAGAAANIFALTAAYGALNKAARSEQVVNGTRQLASAVGESANEILSSIQKITNGQLSLVQSAELANSALSAGFDTKQIIGLTEVAQKASRALGRDLTDSIQRLIRGAAKLEPELIDELGIFTRIGPATEKYAKELGVAAGSLSEFQRRQAFVNAAIEEGNRKFGIIQISANSTQASFEKLSSSLSNVATSVGLVLADTLAPALDLFSGSFNNALIAVIGISTIVFSRLRKELTTFLDFSTSGITKYTDNLVKGTALNLKQIKELRQIPTILQGEDGEPGAGNLKGINKKDQAGLLDRLRTGDSTYSQKKKDIELLKRATVAEQKYQIAVAGSSRTLAYKNAEIAKSALRYDAATAAIDIQTVAVNRATFAQRNFGNAALFASKAIGFLGAALNGLLKFAGIVGIVLSIGQLVGSFFGVDIIGSITDFYKAITQGAKDAKAGNEALAAVITNKIAPSFGLNTKEAEAYTKTVENMIATAKKANSNIKIQEQLKSTVPRANVIAQANKDIAAEQLNTLEGQLNTAISKGNFQDIAALKFAIILDKAGLTEVEKAIGQIARKAEMSSIKVVEAFKRLGIGATDASGNILYMGQIIGTIAKGIDPQFVKFVSTLTKVSELSKNIGEAFSSGAAKAENLENVIGGLSKQTDKLIKESRNLTAGPPNRINIRIEEQTKQLDKYIKLLEDLKRSEKALENIRENYKKELSAFNEASVKGLLSVKAGVISVATTEEEIQTNRINRLNEAIQINGKGARKEKENIEAIIASGKLEGEALREKTARLSEVNNKLKAQRLAVEIVIGSFVLAAKAVKKLNDELDKVLLNLQSQIKLQQLQNNLAVKQAEYAVADAKAKTAIIKLQGNAAAAQSRLNILQAEKSANEAILSNQEKQAEIAKILRDAENDRLDSAYAYLRAQTEVANAQRLQEAQNTQNQQQRFSGLFSEQDKRNTAKEIAKIEYENAVSIIRMQETEREDKYKREAAAIVVERNLLMEGTVARAAIAAQEIQIIDQQIAVARANSAVAKAQAQNNLDNLENNKTIATLQYDVQSAQIVGNRAKALLDLEQYQRQIDYLDKLKQVYEGIGKINDKHIQDELKLYEAQSGETITGLQFNADGFKEVAKQIDEVTEKYKSAVVATNTLFDNQKTNLDKLTGLNEQELKAKIEGAEAALANAGAANAAEIKTLTISKSLKEKIAKLTEEEIQAKISALNTNLIALKDRNDTASITTKAQIAAERNVYEQRLKDIKALENAYAKFASRSLDIVENKLMAGVDSFFDAVQNGTLTLQNFKEGVVQVFQDILFDIAKESFKEDLVQPLIGGVRSYIGGLIPGVGKDDKSKEGGGGSTAASLFEGQFTQDTNSGGEQTANKTAKDGMGIFAIFGDLLTPVFEGLRSFADTIGLTDIVTSIFGLTTENTTGSVAGLGTDTLQAALKTLFKSSAEAAATSALAAFTSAVFSATVALQIMAASSGGGGGGGLGFAAGLVKGGTLFFNSGGRVPTGPRHLAAGGTALRDRAPAMLEPGEFVLRKHAVDTMGFNAASQLNATGNAGVKNIKVQIENSGKPKEASESETLFDAEKAIIKVVLKDYKSNGPIRRTIRGDN